MRNRFKKLNVSLIFILFFVSFSVPCLATHKVAEAINADEDWFCNDTDCFFPGKKPSGFDLVIDDPIRWNKNKNLIIHTQGNITFKPGGKIISEKDGSIILKAGMGPGEEKEYSKTVKFEENSTDPIYIETLGTGKVKIYYNPLLGEERHKYHNPNHLDFEEHIRAGDHNRNLYTYMLVNNVYDLQNIAAFLSGDYALSQDIDATETINWNYGSGFAPLYGITKNMPFSGNFDGNNYTIKGLFINRPNEKKVGLFGICRGFETSHNKVENLILKDFDITGDDYVGSLAGTVMKCDLANIQVINSKIKCRYIAGGLSGSSYGANLESIRVANDINVIGEEYTGFIMGSSTKTQASVLFVSEQELISLLKKYPAIAARSDTTKIYFKFKDSHTGEWKVFSQ